MKDFCDLSRNFVIDNLNFEELTWNASGSVFELNPQN